jgi:WD40 repeat protein
MNTLTNENILKLIFSNYKFTIGEILVNRLKNKLLCILMLRIGYYKNIYRSMGKSNIIFSENDECILKSLALLPNGHFLSASNLGILKVWNTNSLECIKTIDCEFTINSIAILSGGQIAICQNHEVHIWNDQLFSTKIKTISFEDNYRDFNNLLVLTNNNYLAFSAKLFSSYCIIILDCMKNYNCVKIIREHARFINSLINISNNRFASGSYDKKVKIYDSNFNCIKTFEMTNYVMRMLYLRGENILVRLCCLGLSVLNIDTGNCLKIINDDNISALLLLSDGYFASSSFNGQIKIWNSDGFECINTFGLEYDERIDTLLLLKDYRIVSGSFNGKIIIYNYQMNF